MRHRLAESYTGQHPDNTLDPHAPGNGGGNGIVTATPLAQLGRRFATLGFAEIGARLIAFVATAYVSQVVGAANFGVISFALAALLYAQRVVSWELEAVGVIEVAEVGEPGDRAVGTLLGARAACAIVVMILTAMLARWVLPSPDGSVLLLYTAGLVFVALNVRFVYLMRHAAGRPAMARLLAEGVSAAFVISLVHSAADIHRIPLGFIIGEGLAAAFLLASVGFWRGIRDFDFAFARTTARAASPLVLSSLLGLLVFNFDLILLRFSWGSETAGYYAAAYAIVSLLLNLGVTFYSNLLPGLSRLRDDRGAFQALYGDASVLLTVLMLPFVVGGAILARPLIELVFGAGYAPSAAPLVPLLVAGALTLSRFVPLAAVVALGRRREALWINGSGALVNVVLNVVLIPRLGLMGAASATVCTDVVRLAVALALSHRAGLVQPHVSRVGRPVLAAVAMGVVVWWFRERAIGLTVPLGGIVYIATLGALGVVRVERGFRVRLKD
ncbi:MAG: oligosaccharide flippase family protein [Gemmatimonadaceae bacterium]